MGRLRQAGAHVSLDAPAVALDRSARAIGDLATEKRTVVPGVATSVVVGGQSPNLSVVRSTGESVLILRVGDCRSR